MPLKKNDHSLPFLRASNLSATCDATHPDNLPIGTSGSRPASVSDSTSIDSEISSEGVNMSNS